MLFKEEIDTIKFDACVKKALEHELKYRKRSKANQSKIVVNFSDLSQTDENQLYVEDEYEFERFRETIATSLFDATIHDELLHKALLTLNKNNLEIILLKYWGDMTDKEIGQALSMSRKMVNVYRNRSLKHLKKLLEEMREDD